MAKGFILIYTLWVLAACSVLLALLAKSAVQPIEVNEAALTEPIALVEEINILDYVLAHTFAYDLQVDPRFLVYRQALTTENIEASKGAVQELKNMLSQIGMELKIDDDSRGSVESTSVPGTAGDGGSEWTQELTTLRQQTLFGVTDEAVPIRLGDTEYQLMIRPANALPNLNTLPRKAMIRYLIYLGLEQEAAGRLAGVIHDWIDADDFLSENGAESAQYPLGHAPRNGPIQSWSEIYYLRGSSSLLIEFLRNHFTLRSQNKRVSAKYLDTGTLAALTGIPETDVVIALENQALPEDENLPLDELIDKRDAEQFEAMVGWKDDRNIVQITLSGPRLRLSALFDVRQKQIIDWHMAYPTANLF